MPCSFRDPHAKQRCGATSISMPDAESAITRAPRSTAGPRTSDVKVANLPGLGLDEVLPGRDLLAHEHREDGVRHRGVIDLRPEKRSGLRVHRRLPELVGIHLAEALEALHGDVLAVHLLDDAVAFLLGLRVLRDLPGG